MATLNLEHLKKIYDGGVVAVEDFNLKINDGEFIVLVGPSGCGKSTTLRMVAGLEDISQGSLFIDDKDMTNAAPKDRDIAMVFQNYALYSNMTVYENMAFSLSIRKEDPEEIHKKVMAASKIIGLEKQLNKKPAELSGGQRQRVSMGRAIVRAPKVFLFDEPLSNLDAKLRSSMRREIKVLHNNLKATMIYVTHDQTEALTLADRIVVMSMGKVEQIGTPLEVYDDPETVFVGAFIGNPCMNFYLGKIEGDMFVNENFSYQLNDEQQSILREYKDTDKNVYLAIRPENYILDENSSLEFTSDVVEHLGQYSLIHGTLNNCKTVMKIRGWINLDVGQIIKVGFKTKKICFFDFKSGKRIRGI